MSNLAFGGSGKWIGPKKYATLSDQEKNKWNPAWKEYREEKHMEMQYCECCEHELGLGEEVTRIPIGEPYRYYAAGAMQTYFANRFLERASKPIFNDNQLGSKTITFSRYKPLGDEPVDPTNKGNL